MDSDHTEFRGIFELPRWGATNSFHKAVLPLRTRPVATSGTLACLSVFAPMVAVAGLM